MRKLLADLVQESTATTGTGTLTLAAMPGWIRFSDRFSVGDKSYYSIRDGLNWEVGYGQIGASHTFFRNSILHTLVAGTVTIGGAALTLSGAAIVRSVLPEELFSQVWLVRNVTASTSTQLLDGDACGVTASGITLTLPTSPVAGDRVQIYQADNAVLSVIVDPFGEKINGVAGTMTIDVYDFSFDMIYISSAYGWKVLK